MTRRSLSRLSLCDCRYRDMYQWDDGSTGYFLHYSTLHNHQTECSAIIRPGLLDLLNCTPNFVELILCEDYAPPEQLRGGKSAALKGPVAHISNPAMASVPVPHVVCPSGHWTHPFLACDVLSDCWGRGALRQSGGSDAERNMTSSYKSTLSTLFTCRNGVEHVPYSLVCDHSQDCLDDSDEDFCVYPSCSSSEQYDCINKQVRHSKRGS